MNLNTITEVKRPTATDEIPRWQKGYAYLAGGTWLFSTPQIATHTLIDLETLRWPALKLSSDGLDIAATCTIAELEQFQAPGNWSAGPLLKLCCHALLMSFKIWNEATVGGNICMSLPAGPMISLTAALEGVCTLWPQGGEPRQVSVVDFVTGNHQNVLAPGELLRSIFLPAHALRKRSPSGGSRSRTSGDRRRCSSARAAPSATNSCSRSPPPPSARSSSASRACRPRRAETRDRRRRAARLYLDDVHGSPAHRKHLTHYFAEQIRSELSH